MDVTGPSEAGPWRGAYEYLALGLGWGLLGFLGLLRNPLLGPAVRLACWIPNDSPAGSIHQAGANLAWGSHLLLFPEGTRTPHPPLDPLKASEGLIARRSAIPVQTLPIETDSGYLGKGWPILRKPPLPVHYRGRPGRRFVSAQDVRGFTAELELYLRSKLRGVRVTRAESGDGRPVRPAIR